MKIPVKTMSNFKIQETKLSWKHFLTKLFPQKGMISFSKTNQMKNKKQDNENSCSIELKALRDQIDRVDLKILNLINQRLEIGKKIGKIKNETDSHIIDNTREGDIIERLLKLNKGPADNQELKYIFNALIKANRGVQGQK